MSALNLRRGLAMLMLSMSLAAGCTQGPQGLAGWVPAPESAPDVQAAADQAAPQAESASSPVLPHPVGPAQTARIGFRLDPMGADFGLKQVASPGYVKLTITGKVQGQAVSLHAVGADESGFVAIADQTMLSAEVPPGSNWVVTAGFYSNASAQGLMIERKSAFHLSAGGTQVDVNLRTHLVGAIVEQLQLMGSSQLNQPLDLAGLQAFVDGLTGAPGFTRLGETLNGQPIPASPLDVSDIDAYRLALQLHNQEFYPQPLSLTLGQSLDPRNYRRAPWAGARESLDPFSEGVRETLAYDASAGTIFFNDSRSSGVAGLDPSEALYGISFANGAFSRSFKVSVGKVASRTLSTGLANLDGHSPQPVVHLTRQVPTGLELAAFSQSDGSLVWSKTFAALLEGDIGFSPVAWRDTVPNPEIPCGCDDVDVVYTALNAAESGKKGVYKVRGNGVQAGFYQYDGGGSNNFTSTGALSPDGSLLWVLNTSPAELIRIETATMSGTRIALAPYLVRPKVAPVRGKDGTIYVPVYNASGSYLMAFNADGSTKWASPLQLASGSARPDYPPVLDLQSGKARIYVHLNDGQVFALRDDGSGGSLLWQANIGYEPRGSAILGETLSDKYLYIGTRITDQVFALRERDGALLWQSSAGGAFASGFGLLDGYLLLTSREGNDGHKVGLRALKVEAQRLTTSAPWPKYGGGPGNTGVGQ